MLRRHQALIRGIWTSLILVSEPVWACATCGQSFKFSPQMLVISAGFFLLPIAIVGFIAWKLWKDEQRNGKSHES